jgi:hypothetical protein
MRSGDDAKTTVGSERSCSGVDVLDRDGVWDHSSFFFYRKLEYIATYNIFREYPKSSCKYSCASFSYASFH